MYKHPRILSIFNCVTRCALSLTEELSFPTTMSHAVSSFPYVDLNIKNFVSDSDATAGRDLFPFLSLTRRDATRRAMMKK